MSRSLMNRETSRAWFCAALVVGFGSVAAPRVRAQEQAVSPSAVAAATNLTRPQILATWGWIIARDQDLRGIELSDAERVSFLKGFADGMRDRPLAYDAVKIFPDVERLAKARQEGIVRARRLKNEAAAKTFFGALAKNTNVFDLPGGVRAEMIRPGNGAFPRLQQTVNVHYTGRLMDGTEFAQMGPLDLVLVTNRSVCRGWTDAVQKLNPGGALRLYVPPPLSDDDAVRWGIEPGSAMVFEIELFGVNDTSPEDLANSLLPPAPESEPPPPSGYADAQIIEAWGWDVAHRARAAKFGLNEADLAALAKGLGDGVRAQPPAVDLRVASPQVEQFIADGRQRARLKEQQARRAETEALFAALAKNTNVVQLPDGLRYEIIRPGHGAYPKPGQVVVADYTGRLIDGTVFDKTYNEPLHIEIGSVIAGLNEGLQKINRGGKIKLYVPPPLGYGDEDLSGVVAPIPAGSALIYEIALLEILDAPPAK